MRKHVKKFLFIGLTICLIGSMVSMTSPIENISAQGNESAENNDLQINKITTDNGDGTYTVSMEAYTTGTVTTVQKAKPTDIVLVLDQSGSMKEYLTYNSILMRVYADNIGTTNPYYSEPNYYKNAAGEYIKLTKSSTLGTIPTVEGPHPLNLWSDGVNEYVPLKNDGTNPTPEVGGTTYPAVEMYGTRKEGIGNTKLQILQNAANAFLENIRKDGGDHRVAVVGFASGDMDASFNTELYIGSNTYNYESAALPGRYASAFQPVQTHSSVLKSSINSLDASGDTRTDLGLEMANNIFANDPLAGDSTRNKVVVMFTDGEPNNGRWGVSDIPEYPFFQKTVANDALNKAAIAKANYGANLYTIGVVDSLDPSKDPSLASTSIMDRFMHFASSNYPNATSLTNAGVDGDYTKGNYLAATDEESLKKIFDKINEDITSSTADLDDKTVLKDIMSEYFKTPEASNVKVYTSACTGNVNGQFTWADRVVPTGVNATVDKASASINVTGFNYNENVVAINEATGDPQGKKLIVEFTTTKKDGFIGGTQVPTNNENSGIYVADTLFEAFPQPKVDLKVNYSLADNRNLGIYVGTQGVQFDRIFDTNWTTEGIQYFIGSEEYTIDGINNAFVDTVYNIYKGSTVIGQYKIPAGQLIGEWIIAVDPLSLKSNTDFTVEVNVTDAKDTSNTVKDNANHTIYVFTPTITVSDATIFLGDSVTLRDSVTEAVSWTNTDSTAEQPLDPIPTLTYKYFVNGSSEEQNGTDPYEPQDDQNVKMLVNNNDVDITNETTIKNKKEYTDKAFKVNVIKGRIDITKVIDQQYTEDEAINANQSFVFKIERRDTIDGDVVDTIYQTINFSANQNDEELTASILGLRKGYYTISEDTSWSWKYELTSATSNTASGSVENIHIGEMTANRSYFGAESNDPAKVRFTNNMKSTVSGVIGDVAAAVNNFNK